MQPRHNAKKCVPMLALYRGSAVLSLQINILSVQLNILSLQLDILSSQLDIFSLKQ